MAETKHVGVVLVGGDSTTTSFRPLSLATPAPLIRVAGFSVAEPAIRALASVPGMAKIFIIGFFDREPFDTLCERVTKDTGVETAYLFEPRSLGTAGGIHIFADDLRKPLGGDGRVFVLYGDNFGDFPLAEMLAFHESHARLGTVLGTRVPRERAPRYGVLVKDRDTSAVVHYAEKPASFISDLANCGVYIFDDSLFGLLGKATAVPASPGGSSVNRRYHIDGDLPPGFARLEQDVVQKLCGTGDMLVFEHGGLWDAIKTAAMLLEANSAYLAMMARGTDPCRALGADECRARLARTGAGAGCSVTGNVLIDPSATVHPTAKVGPDVYIGPNVQVGPGARIRNSILFEGTRVMDNSCVMHALIGAGSVIGAWARIEGVTVADVDRHEHMRAGNVVVFGEGVRAHSEIVVRGCVVLPRKTLTSSASNEILL